MKIILSTSFKRAAKKLHKNQIKLLEKAIEEIKINPLIGELKTGNLADVRVYKFRILHQLILLAYLFDEHAKEITLLAFAPHENFYENLKLQIHEEAALYSTL